MAKLVFKNVDNIEYGYFLVAFNTDQDLTYLI